MRSVFITAAGTADRFNGEVKQLLSIMGEPIIGRTIRLVKQISPESKIYIITWREVLKYFGVSVLHTHKPTPTVIDTILFSRPYWTYQNIFLLGDVVYHPQTLKNILQSDKTRIWGRKTGDLIKSNNERYALTINSKDVQYIINKCKLSKESIPYTSEHGGLLNLLMVMQKFPIRLLFPIKLKKLAFLRPVRDFGYYHIYKQFLPHGPHFEVIDEPYTTDIDTFDEYLKFCEVYEYGRLFPRNCSD